MTVNGRAVAGRISQKEGDRIARMVLDLVQELARSRRVVGVPSLPSPPEPTGVFVEADVWEFVMKRSA